MSADYPHPDPVGMAEGRPESQRQEAVTPQLPIPVAEDWDDRESYDREETFPLPPTPADDDHLLRREWPESALPHPGFWWAILWCFGMVLVSQVIVPIAITLVLVAVSLIQGGGGGVSLHWLNEPAKSSTWLAYVLAGSQITIVLLSVLGLRLVVGKGWTREVGLRLPALQHVLLAVVGVPGLWLAAAGCYLLVKENMPGLPHLPNYVLSWLSVLGAVVGYWTVVRVTTGKDWVRELAGSRPATQFVLGVMGVFMVLLLVREVFVIFRPYLGTLDKLLPEGIMEDLVKNVRNWPMAAGVLIVGLCPGVAEELWCRGFLGRGLVGRHGVVMGVILTSFFFGLIHLDPHQGTMAAVMGLALHFTYLMTRSLLVPMLLHFLNNTLSVVADKLPDPLRAKLESVDADPTLVPIGLILAGVLLMAAVGWAFYESRARLVRVDGSNEPPWQPPFAGVAHPPEGSGTAVVASWPGLWPSLAVIFAVMTLVAALFYL